VPAGADSSSATAVAEMACDGAAAVPGQEQRQRLRHGDPHGHVADVPQPKMTWTVILVSGRAFGRAGRTQRGPAPSNQRAPRPRPAIPQLCHDIAGRSRSEPAEATPTGNPPRHAAGRTENAALLAAPHDTPRARQHQPTIMLHVVRCTQCFDVGCDRRYEHGYTESDANNDNPSFPGKQSFSNQSGAKDPDPIAVFGACSIIAAIFNSFQSVAP
jgi:hypothetical protein